MNKQAIYCVFTFNLTPLYKKDSNVFLGYTPFKINRCPGFFYTLEEAKEVVLNNYGDIIIKSNIN